MELSWPMKLRIAASAAIGVVLIGILAWPLAAPSEPFGTVSLLGGGLTTFDAVFLAILAFFSGFAAYFASWPHGREIGILAVPAGLTIWGIRSGSMVNLIRSTAPTNLPELFASLRWEPLYWLAIVTAGFAGVLLAQKIKAPPEPEKNREKPKSRGIININEIIALVASVVIAQLCINVFAQGIRLQDPKIGSVVAQPSIGQIVYGVFISFGLAAFVVKKFLDVSYIWPTIAGAFVTAFAVISYGRQDVLQHLGSNWPAVFFSHSTLSILPVQMVALGALGSIAGYWMAIRYNYWRKHG